MSTRAAGDGTWIASTTTEQLRFPDKPPLVCLSHVAVGYERWLRRKYSLDGFVSVDAGDAVVDCGAFIGGFALAASRTARKVVAVEPSPASAQCCRMNCGPAVATVDGALWSEDGRLSLQLGATAIDNSLLSPDVPGTGEIDVRTYTLDSLAAATALDQIDFLKLEAEGAEVEVLEGARSVEIRKLAIDCSAERHGASPWHRIEHILWERGYETAFNGRILFARLENRSTR